MTTRLFNKIKNFFSGILQSRIVVLGIFFVVLFALLIQKTFSLQIIHGADYLESFTYRIQKETELPEAPSMTGTANFWPITVWPMMSP